jgi:hypothetical protein
LFKVSLVLCFPCRIFKNKCVAVLGRTRSSKSFRFQDTFALRAASVDFSLDITGREQRVVASLPGCSSFSNLPFIASGTISVSLSSARSDQSSPKYLCNVCTVCRKRWASQSTQMVEDSAWRPVFKPLPSFFVLYTQLENIDFFFGKAKTKTVQV